MKFEILTADPASCDDLVRRVRHYADERDEVQILDARAPGVAERAKALGVESWPALLINGRCVPLDDE
jgi:hypothetical protein